ncbi:hypothetical protein PV10_03421 [Exophiala mesophila]|uniref:Uncharacterized protein n=1 Tax=Exophiala mesophila TaxID=212818 RepID=A0A0D1X203_EXOME|nr:uncharacterized protein PV10_03421 [Exophiala mesophila]KIV95815.1 hypothetical protein PV10_03421 [Exophiala mesophila]
METRRQPGTRGRTCRLAQGLLSQRAALHSESATVLAWAPVAVWRGMEKGERHDAGWFVSCAEVRIASWGWAWLRPEALLAQYDWEGSEGKGRSGQGSQGESNGSCSLEHRV